MRIINRPLKNEYPAYSQSYFDLIDEDSNIFDLLQNNLIELKNLILNLPEDKLNFRYAEGKWTIKEILVHLIDDERIYVYRALRFARNDKTELPGFDENLYTKYSSANTRSVESIFSEYESVRNATITFFENIPEEALLRTGIAEGKVNERSVRAYLYHIMGHELQHIKMIKEKYLK